MASSRKNKALETLGGPFAAIPIRVLDHEDFWSVSSTAICLLLCLAAQFISKKFNNGDLCAAQSVMAKYGWKDATRKRALKQLEDAELIVKTRQGHKRRCSLYALSWLPIDRCPGKDLEIGPCSKPWKDYKGAWYKKRNLKLISDGRK